MFDIKKLFKEEDLIQTGNGEYKLVCPDCGPQGGRTEGFILFPKTNTSYCHSSHKHFNLLETYALTKKLIRCLDGNDTGEKRKILEGNLFTEVLGRLKEDFGEEDYDDIIEMSGLKKRIELPGSGILISDFATMLSHRIKKQNIFFYRGDTRKVVEVGKIKVNEKDYSYNGFLEVDSNRFITIIEKYFIPWITIFTKNGSMQINKSMSHSIANVVLVADNFRDVMPVINRILNVQIPILIKETNTLCLPNKGYDEKFLSWVPYNSPVIDNYTMTLEEAKKNIDTLFKEFCFKSEQDKTNAIAAFITPFIRGLFSSFSIRTPIFIYEANRERAGKDYLAGLTGILYEGFALEEPPISTGEKDHNNTDELKKKLLSAMIYGRKRLHFSNNKGYLNNAVFESVTTSEKWSDRILGKNEIVTFSNELDFSLSGNIGMTLTPDLANRSRFIKLFLDIEDANLRVFENPDLHGWLKNNRNLILSSLYCLVKNWINTGQKSGTIPFASFYEWSKICGGILEAAGYGNPCVKNTDMVGIAMDSETTEMKELFELCYSKKPNVRLKKADIIEIIKEDGGLFANFNWDTKSDQTKFGAKFIKYVGRIFSNIKLSVFDSSISRTIRWEFIFSKENGHLGHLGHLPTTVQNAIVNREFKSSLQVSEVSKVSEIEGNIIKLPIINQPLPSKPISDREIQFREAEECKDIKPHYKEEDLIKWIEDNPDYNSFILYDKFGVGSFKSELNYWRKKESEMKNGN
jgi:hypothetical protein